MDDALVAHVEGLAVVPPPLAHLARHVDVGQEVHLDLHQAVALARLAAPALDVEGEAPRLVPAHARLRGAGEQRADEGEHAGVGGGVRARRAADGRLVDVHDLVQMLGALHPVVGPRPLLGPVEHLGQRAIEDVVDEGRLAGAGDPRDARERAQGDAHGHALEVVLARVVDGDELPVALAPGGAAAGSPRVGPGSDPSATRRWRRSRRGCRWPPRARPARRPRARGRPRSRRRGSSPRRARRRARCCRDRAGA